MSAPAEPSVRATLVRMLLRRAHELWPDDAAALDAAPGPEGAARLARTPGYDWVPFETEVAIVRAVHARHGDEGARRLGIEVARAGARHALLRPVIWASLGMLGRRPAALAENVAGVWRMATRNAGRLVASAPAPGEVCLAHEDLPPVLHDRGFLVRMGALAEGVLGIAGLTTALAVEWEPGSPSARLRVSWRRPG